MIVEERKFGGKAFLHSEWGNPYSSILCMHGSLWKVFFTITTVESSDVQGRGTITTVYSNIRRPLLDLPR